MSDWGALVEEIFINGKYLHWVNGMSDPVAKLTFVVGYHEESKTWSVDIKSVGHGTNLLTGAGESLHAAWLDALHSVIEDKQKIYDRTAQSISRDLASNMKRIEELDEMKKVYEGWRAKL